MEIKNYGYMYFKCLCFQHTNAPSLFMSKLNTPLKQEMPYSTSIFDLKKFFLSGGLELNFSITS